VRDRFLHRQVVKGGLLARHDEVHVVAAAQAVIGDREQGVRVGREVDADDLGLLVHDVVDEARILVGEAVVVLSPHVRGEEVVERRYRAAPWNLPSHLQPLRVLVEHRVDDVDEGLVAVEEAVAAGQQVALQPPLAEVLGQDLHHASVRREALVGRCGLRKPGSRRDVEDVSEAVRRRLVRPEEAEVVTVPREHVLQKGAEHPRGLAARRSWARDVDGIGTEVR
jgi:hypothetical protein